MSSRPVREGFRPTPSMWMTLPGRPAARAPQKAAPEMSPGTLTVAAASAAARRATPTDRPSRSTRYAERGEGPLRMIPCRGRLDDDGRARRVEAGQQHAALDLGARDVRLIGDALQRAPRRWSAAAGRRPTGWSRPSAVSGAMTRRIGRRVSDASPMMTVRNGCAAARPDSSRIVVPGIGGVDRPWRGGQAVQAAAGDFDGRRRCCLDRDARGRAGRPGWRHSRRRRNSR